MNEIRFNYEWEAYGCLSNYARIGFELDGVWWPSSEHYYHLQKFVYPSQTLAESDQLHDSRRDIYQAATPGDAKFIAERDKDWKHPDWDNIKDDVMRRAVHRKFDSNPALAAILLSTGDAGLIENSKKDAHFGCGPDDKGKNMLGKILMEVRNKLRRDVSGK